jgi:hypothetical protein
MPDWPELEAALNEAFDFLDVLDELIGANNSPDLEDDDDEIGAIWDENSAEDDEDDDEDGEFDDETGEDC